MRLTRCLTTLLMAALLLACASRGPLEIPTDEQLVTRRETARTSAPSNPSIYRLGMLGEVTTDNYWAYFDSGSTVWNSYLLAPTKPSLYTVNYPGIEFVADLADTTATPRVVQRHGGFIVTVPMRREARWSDGEPITASDIVFTFATVRDLRLGGNWLRAYPVASPDRPSQIGLLAVRQSGEFEVEFEFNLRPGLPVWPHAVGMAPIMAEHHWSAQVEAARGSADPRADLFARSGRRDPSGGPMLVAELEPGAYATSVANDNFHRRLQTIRSGGVTFRTGPHVDDAVFSFFGEQDNALLALKAGEVDFVLNPLGMQRGLIDLVQHDENLASAANPSNGFRYLGFNLRRAPMSSQAFRDAVALMVDREFVAHDVLGGSAYPVYVSIPEGNARWFNAAAAREIAAPYVGRATDERLRGAVELLAAAGFSWEAAPHIDVTGAVVAGSPIRFEGELVRPLELLAPGPTYDPLRATYAVWIETWLEQLGFSVEIEATDFNNLISSIYLANEAGELDFDLYLLGWSLGDPSLPTHYEDFWSSRQDTLTNKGNNTTGFSDPEFDALVDRFNALTSDDEAFDLIWRMERIIAREKPYLLLFDTGILEFYRVDAIEFPFTDTLSGIQHLAGMQGLVKQMK